MEDISLYENDWLSLRMLRDPDKGVDGYVYAHETRCAGAIVAVLPFGVCGASRRYLLRKEVTPCWGMEPAISAITGGVEDGSVIGTVLEELEEEAGLKTTAGDLVHLGACRGTKSSDTVYYLFAVNIRNCVEIKARGDGSKLEAMAECVWRYGDVGEAADPLVYALHYRLQEYLATQKGRV